MNTVRKWSPVLLVMAFLAPGLIAQVVENRVQPPQKLTGATAGPTAPAEPTSPADHRRSKGRHSGVSKPPPALVEKPAPTPEPAPAPPPPTAAQLPPTPPQVIYRDGMLTVVANNSTLGDILSQVRLKTGASIEYPPTLSQERVVATIGPAPAPQVLAALLNGSRFDYILLGANGRPDLLQKAIITSKDGGGVIASSAAPAVAVPQPRRGAGAQPAPGDEDSDMQPDDTVDQPEEVPQPQPQPPQPVQPQPVPQAVPNQPFPTQPGQPQQPTVKTPEQLLQELQRLQQQQQQQQPQPPQQ